MKLSYCFEANEGATCPVEALKRGRRIKWYDREHDCLMFGPLISVTGNKVVAGDDKFGTKERHTLSRDEVSWVGEPEEGQSTMKVVWQRQYKSSASSLSAKELPAKKSVAEAASAKPKHTLNGNKLDFSNDMEVEELVLTKTDPHDIARLITRIAVLNAFVDESKKHGKDQDYRRSQEPEDLVGEKAHTLDTDAVAEAADDIAGDIARSVKDYVSALRRSDFNELVWHYFPELK